MAGIFSLQRHKQHSKRRPVKSISRPAVQEPVYASWQKDVVEETHELVRQGEKKVVDRDDFLLSQIDEFREKAKQLQEILATKETKAQELETIVQERELKAEELQQILDERQQRADGISAEVTKQIDVLIDKVNAKMQEIEQNINSDIENMEKSISDNLEESQKETAEQNSQMMDTLSELNDQLLALKQDLSEKVHTENVKSYRNIQDLFKVQGEKIDSVNNLKESISKVKAIAIGTLVVGIINILGIAAIALYLLGIIRF